MASHPRHHLSERVIPPADVTDILLWRLALDVAAAHQPDEHGNCRNLRCVGEHGICQVARLARQAMDTARAPARPASTPSVRHEIEPGRAVASQPVKPRSGGFIGWFTATTTRVRNRWSAPVAMLPRRIPGAALAA